MLAQLFLIRHGETAWSLSGQHTGYTDVPLTEKGERDAQRLATRLKKFQFSEVFTSPRLRARHTAELAGFGTVSRIEPDLAEWNYGTYEGLRSSEIHQMHPDWNIFWHGCPGGESPAEISARADRLLIRLRAGKGNIAVFSHGHFGRVLAARWIDAPANEGRRLLLRPASISILSYEHDDPAAPVISLWNEESTVKDE